VAPTRLRHPGATRPKSAGVVGQPFAGLLRGAREWRVEGKYRLTAKPTSGTVAALADLVDVEQAAQRNFCALADNEVIKAVEKRTSTTRTKRRQPRKENGHTRNKGAANRKS
jgi:hypothetical protein